MYDNDLIYGKDKTERIVSLEVKDNYVELYIQNEDGSIDVEFKPNKYWLLSNTQIDKSWARLKGDLTYKYGKQYTAREDFTKFRYLYKQRADIYSIWNEQEAAMVKDGYTLFKGLKHNELSVLSFDLETLGTVLDVHSKILIIANTFRDSSGKIKRKMFCYDMYPTQAAMITAWCKWVQEVNPTILCGHNINTFDIPYLQHIADLNNISLPLGRDGSDLKIDKRESKFRKDGSQFITYKKSTVFGRHVVDTYFLAFKYDFSRKYESYALKQIIKQEGLEDPNRQHYDASLIRKNYTIPEEWVKIKKYAEFDGDDGLKLFDLMSPAQFYWCQKVPKSFQSLTESATGSQINSILVRSYLQNAHSIPAPTEIKEYQGAISLGNPGIYKNAIKWDVASLYPSIILDKKIYDSEKDPEAHFLKLVTELREERLMHKKLAKETGKGYYSDMEQSEKIGINSAYGTLGAPGLNFNSPNNAEKVTEVGREILNKAIEWATGQNSTAS